MSHTVNQDAEQPVTDVILELERRRCDAIADDDLGALRELLAPTLVHVHTRGNQDSLESYLAYITGTVEILNVRRDDLRVDVYDDCAVVTGRQINSARLRGTDDEPIEVESQVIQVWIRADDRWRQAAFQATPLGALPPPPPR